LKFPLISIGAGSKTASVTQLPLLLSTSLSTHKPIEKEKIIIQGSNHSESSSSIAKRPSSYSK
jgi:hypothetical protein